MSYILKMWIRVLFVCTSFVSVSYAQTASDKLANLYVQEVEARFADFHKNYGFFEIPETLLADSRQAILDALEKGSAELLQYQPKNIKVIMNDIVLSMAKEVHKRDVVFTTVESVKDYFDETQVFHASASDDIDEIYSDAITKGTQKITFNINTYRSPWVSLGASAGRNSSRVLSDVFESGSTNKLIKFYIKDCYSWLSHAVKNM